VSLARYGRWSGGPDPLAAPADVRAAIDALGERMLAGESASAALHDVLQSGLEGQRGLRELREALLRRRRELQRSGTLDGTLQEVRRLLAKAVDLERAQLDTDPSPQARWAQTELDLLPDNTAQAVQELAQRQWHCAEAESTYQQIRELLAREAMTQQFPGFGRRPPGDAAESGQTPAGDPRDQLKDFLADLNRLLGAHARGEDTREQFAEFMARHGDMFDSDPQDVDELIDELARRAAAAARLMASLTPQQRAELQQLMDDMLSDLDLAAEMSALNDTLRGLRPGYDWSGRQRMSGEQGLSFGDGTAALAEIAELDDLERSLTMRPIGSTLDDVDVEAVERQLGPAAAREVRRLQELDAELRRQGWLHGEADELELSPKALRRMGQSALARVLADLESSTRGSHDDRRTGSAGELIGSSRPWLFGDEQPLDVVQTVRNAVLRTAGAPAAAAGERARGSIALNVEDFVVAETEHRSGAAVALCFDLSWSMYAQDRWAAMKQTALALDHLIATKYPQDVLQLIGFGLEAQVMSRAELAAVQPSGVPGTNLAQALRLARVHLRRHPRAEPVLLVITDGEPTAHTLDNGRPYFAWPTTTATVRATVHEVDECTRHGIVINTFMLGDDPGLHRFIEAMARRGGGRVFAPHPERLGEFVVRDYLRSRRSRR
jgi:uncharacterized protein with von Willebrand factor type A (vWA) domain